MDVNRPDVVAEVLGQFRRYEQALVGNDVPVLDELFWNSPRAVRFGARENLYGHEAIARFREHRDVEDLARELLRVDVATFGSDFAAVSAEFLRSGSGVTGRQQQTWARTDEGWRIVAAHVSHLPAAAPGAAGGLSGKA